MKVSNKAVTVLKHYEQGPKGGHAKVPYICPTGHKTIGYGHVILKHEEFIGELSEAAATTLLMSDLNKFCGDVTALLDVEPTQDQFDAMVLLAFNTGVGIADDIGGDFADSTLLKMFNQSKFQLAAAQFHKWVYGKVGGKSVVLKGLVARRKTEATLFLTGQVQF